MFVRSLSSRGTFDDLQVHVLSAALEEALRLTDIVDRTGLRAEAVAHRIIDLFKTGETDPRRIARLVART